MAAEEAVPDTVLNLHLSTGVSYRFAG